MTSRLRSLAISWTVLLGTAGAFASPAAELSTPQDLVEQGLMDKLVLSPSGELIAWDVQAGRGFGLGPRPGRQRLDEFSGPEAFRIAVSPRGHRAFLTEGTRAVEIHRTDGTRRRLELGEQVADVAWLDDQRLALSPHNGDHLVEVWNVEAGKLVQGIQEVPRISEDPGYRPVRVTVLTWDPSRHRLHTLDAFNGRYRVYELSPPDDSGGIFVLAEAQIEDRKKSLWQERIARVDEQLKQQGEFQSASIWRFSVALDPDGTAWMVERCDRPEAPADAPEVVAHLLAVDAEGATHRLSVETPCCSRVVPWADVLAFFDPVRSTGPGCFATVPRPSLESSSNASGWLEVTPLSPRSGSPSRRDNYPPARIARFRAAADLASAFGRLPPPEPGLALACTGGPHRALACAQVWLEPDTGPPEGLPVTERPGRPVTGRITSEGTGVVGASVALVPAELRSTRHLTLPLEFPEGAREPAREVLTGRQGRFTLPELAPGDYRLLLELPGGRIDWSTTFTVTPPRPGREGASEAASAALDLGELDFSSGLELEVVITGPDGQPIPGAQAGAAQEAPDAPAQRSGVDDAVLYRAEAGEDGRAVIEGLAPDRFVVVTCRAPGHSPWRQRFDAPPSFVPCALDPQARVTGRVVDEGGEPLPEAELSLMGGAGYAAGAVETTKPGDDGRFEIANLEPGRFRLEVASPGRTARHLEFQLEAGGARDLGELVLEPGGRWIHRVTDGANGEPVPGATLTAVSPRGALRPATTDVQGEVEVEGPSSGPLTLELRAQGYAPRRVDVPESARTLSAEPHEIVLEKGGWLVARAWDEASRGPCVGCAILLSGPGPRQSLVTDASGVARSEPLAPGTWRASLSRLEGFGAVVSRSGGDNVRTTTVASGATAEVRFGEPEETLEVLLSPPPGQPGAWQLVVRDASGSVRLYPLDASGSASVDRPRGEAAVSLRGAGTLVRLGTLAPDATDPAVIDRPSGALSATMPPELETSGPVQLELVELATGRVAAQVYTPGGGRIHVPFLRAGVYEVRGGGRSLATATVVDGQETALGSLD